MYSVCQCLSSWVCYELNSAPDPAAQKPANASGGLDTLCRMNFYNMMEAPGRKTALSPLCIFFQLLVFWGTGGHQNVPVIAVPLHALYTSLIMERDRGDVVGWGGG